MQFGTHHSYPEQAAYQRQPFPHSVSSPFITNMTFSQQPPPSPIVAPNVPGAGPAPTSPSLPQPPSMPPVKRHQKRRSSVNQSTSPSEAQRYAQLQAQLFSAGYPQGGPTGPQGLAVALPDDGSTPSLVKSVVPSDMHAQAAELALRVTPSHAPRARRPSHRRASSNLHPYVSPAFTPRLYRFLTVASQVMTFTSPIGELRAGWCGGAQRTDDPLFADLADLNSPSQDLPRTTI